MSAMIMVGEPEPYEILDFENEVFDSVCRLAAGQADRIPQGFGLEAVLESRRYSPDDRRGDKFNIPPDDQLCDYRSWISLRLRISGHDVQRGGSEDRSDIDIVSVRCSVFGSRMVYYIDRFELRRAVTDAIDELCGVIDNERDRLDFAHYYDMTVFPPRERRILIEEKRDFV